MNSLFHFPELLSAEVVERLGWTLVHTLWQFAGIALLVEWLVRLIPRSSSEMRYGVMVAALMITCVAPIITWGRIPIDFHSPRSGEETSAPDSLVSSEPSTNVGRWDEGSMSSVRARRESATAAGGARPSGPLRDLSDSRDSFARTWSQRVDAYLRPWLRWFVSAWMLGVIVGSVRPLRGWSRLQQLRRSGVSPVAEDVMATLGRVAARMGLPHRVEMKQSTLAEVPLVLGYLRPLILLPIGLVTNLPASQLEAILAHELAHVQRHDFVVNLTQSLIETLFFYHPAIWRLSRRIRIEREHCCDDCVVRLLDDRAEYARALITIEQWRSERSLFALGAADGSLLSRVQRMFALPAHPGTVSIIDRWPPIVLGIVLVGIFTLTSINWNLADDNTESPQAVSPERKTTSPAYTLPDRLNVMAVGFDPTSQRLWSVATERSVTVRTWDVAEGKLIREVNLEDNRSGNLFLQGQLTLSADRERVLAIAEDQVRIWATATGKLVKVLELPQSIQRSSLRGLAVTPDLSLVACGVSSGLGGMGVDHAQAVVWEVDSGRVLQTVTHEKAIQLQCVALSDDGTRLATGGQQSGVRVWETRSGKQLHVLPNNHPNRRHPNAEVSEAAADQVLSLRFSPDGRQLAIGDMLGVQLIDSQSGERLHSIDAPFRMSRSGLMFSPDGHLLARVDTDREVLLWSAKTGRLLHRLATEAHSGTFSSDSGSFAVGFTDGLAGIAVWHLSDLPLASTPPSNTNNERNPTEASVATAGHGHSAGLIRRLRSKEVVHSESASPIFAVRFTGEDSLVGASTGVAQLWDIKTGAPIHRLSHANPGANVLGLAVSPDGSLIVTSALDDTLAVWDRATGRRKLTLRGHGKRGGIRLVRFKPDGNQVVSWGDDGILRRWNVQDGSLAAAYTLDLPGYIGDESRRPPFGYRTAEAFTPDASVLVVAFEGKLFEFDTREGKRLREVAWDRWPEPLALSGDGQWMAAGESRRNQDGDVLSARVVLWDRVTLQPIRSWPIKNPRSNDADSDVQSSLDFLAQNDHGIVFSPDSKLLAWSRLGTHSGIDLVDVQHDQMEASIPVESPCWCLEFSENGHRIASGHSDSSIMVWNRFHPDFVVRPVAVGHR